MIPDTSTIFPYSFSPGLRTTAKFTCDLQLPQKYSNPKSFVNFLLPDREFGEGWGGVKNLRLLQGLLYNQTNSEKQCRARDCTPASVGKPHCRFRLLNLRLLIIFTRLKIVPKLLLNQYSQSRFDISSTHAQKLNKPGFYNNEADSCKNVFLWKNQVFKSSQIL